MIIQPFFFHHHFPHSLHIRKKRDLIKYSDIFFFKKSWEKKNPGTTKSSHYSFKRARMSFYRYQNDRETCVALSLKNLQAMLEK